jgi:hypothetical protein
MKQKEVSVRTANTLALQIQYRRITLNYPLCFRPMVSNGCTFRIRTRDVSRRRSPRAYDAFKVGVRDLLHASTSTHIGHLHKACILLVLTLIVILVMNAAAEVD